MKIFPLFLLLSCSLCLQAQHKKLVQPFMLKGQITNCSEEYLRIFYRLPDGRVLQDTLKLDREGKFYLRSTKVTQPLVASIQQKNIQINDFFVAPGYELTITGEGKDFLSLARSKKIAGRGAAPNRYRFMLDSIQVARMDTTKWYTLLKEDLLQYAKRDRKLKDSVARVVFAGRSPKDPYMKQFEAIVQDDIRFQELYLLLAHISMNGSKYSYEETRALVEDNTDSGLISRIYDARNLASGAYRNWIVTGEWPSYLITLDKKADTAKSKNSIDKLQKIAAVYPAGAVKDYALTMIMEGRAEFANTLEKLNNYKTQFEPYKAMVMEPAYADRIGEAIARKEAELLITQTGKPAPSFTLSAIDGKAYSLSDFAGKVVYIDLWASWCHPCRQEVPDYRKLYAKYKDDSRIVFMGIAVQDGINEWKKALAEDKPDWLQLIDKDDKVWTAYVANTIPKFIVVDKQGNIANFDAPRPSSGETIEKLLLQEMAK